MHSRSNSIKRNSYIDANEVVDQLFEPLPSRYQGHLETSMRGSDFIFDSFQLMYYECHNIDVKRGGSYVDSLDWIKKQKATINPEKYGW